MQSYNLKFRIKKFLFFGVFLFALFGFVSVAKAATYYISPAGSDSNSGTSTSVPWKTFPFAIPKLNPGDILILKDGTYTSDNSGFPYIVCGTNANNGNSSAPIKVKAENERRAFFQSNGNGAILNVQYCSYWTFEGLRFKGADYQGTDNNPLVLARFSDHIIFRRLLVTNSNRYLNAHLLSLLNTQNSLVEESEFYYYHRHAVTVGGINTGEWNGNVYRRNYANGRGYPNILGGYDANSIAGGDAGFAFYPASNGIMENNIAEGGQVGFDIEPEFGPAHDNKFLGNIAIGNQYGTLINVRGNTLSEMSQNTYIENQVSIGSSPYGGIFLFANKNSKCMNCSALNGSGGGIVAKTSAADWYVGDGASSVYLENVLSVGNSPYGFNFINQSSWSVTNSNAYSNGVNYSPPVSDSHYVNSKSIDPALGACKVWIPDSSPMKRAGKNGADIGANVLYHYQDGVLTNQPLWDKTTGEFPHGAIVAGLNDIPGQSLFDINKRLNVNYNGCAFPAGYASSSSDATPTPTQSADLNSDSRVNSVDAAILMGAWGQTSKPKADINQDGIVNSVDASLMMGQWTS